MQGESGETIFQNGLVAWSDPSDFGTKLQSCCFFCGPLE